MWKQIKNNILIQWPLGDVFSCCLMIFPATLSPFCQSGSHIGRLVVWGYSICLWVVRSHEMGYFFIYLRAFHKFKSRANRIQIKTCTYINMKHTNIIQKLVPAVLLLEDASIIDRFGLAFLHRLLFLIKLNEQKQLQIKKILYKCIKANTNAMWQHMLHMPPTKLLIS